MLPQPLGRQGVIQYKPIVTVWTSEVMEVDGRIDSVGVRSFSLALGDYVLIAAVLLLDSYLH